MGIYALKGRLIDGNGSTPVESGLVLIKDERIDFAGKAGTVKVPKNAEVIEIKNGSILPGFIDCHSHFTGTGSTDISEIEEPHFDQILRASRDVGVLLEAGFTGARDMSLFGPHLRKAIEAGYIRGPRITYGGRMLSVTAGHGDMHVGIPREWVNRNSTVCYLVDGVDECLRGTRVQFRNGADFIKVSATGGVSSSVDGVDDVQFSFEELEVIVEEARRHDTYVAAHCTGATGTKQALRAGITSVEHGVMLDQECVDLMAENGASLVTTLTIPLALPHMEHLPAFMREKGALCAEACVRSIELVRKAGIRIALGTDYSNSKNSPYTELGKEFASMVKAGMSPMEAIQAGTKNGAFLMKMEDKIGTVEAGKLADVVIVRGNPLEDISILTGTANIEVVFKNGHIEKSNSSANTSSRR